LTVIALLFREERRVGRHTIENADCRKRLDVFHAAGINKSFIRPLSGG
jgi:hypothetical protein